MGSFVFERTLPGTNEVFGPDGAPRPVYDAVFEELEKTGPERWVERLRRAHGLLLDEQYAFGIRTGDRTHPTDWFPRVVPRHRLGTPGERRRPEDEAVNEFLRRLEAGKEEVVPEGVIETSILYDPTSETLRGGAVRQVALRRRMRSRASGAARPESGST